MVAFKSQGYWSRNWIILTVLSILVIIFIYQIINIHLIEINNSNINQIAIKKSEKNFMNNSFRGDILDRNGEILATSLIFNKINLDPTIIQKEFEEDLSNILGISFNEYQERKKTHLSKKQGKKNWIILKNITPNDPMIENIKKLQSEKRETCEFSLVDSKPNLYERILDRTFVKNFIPKKERRHVCKRNQKIQGVAIQEEIKRYYPRGAALAPLIGRLDGNSNGISGLEFEFNELLKGVNGEKKIIYDQETKIYFNPRNLVEKKDGLDLKLTIDSNIQFIAYDAIKNSVKRHDAESGSAIILSPNGEIIAMVNYPSDDPNDKTSYNPENYRNRVLSDMLEPGSTMKPFTMLTALDHGKIKATEDECFDVTKRIGHVIPTYKDKKTYKCLTVKQILQKSHNLGTVNVMEKLDKETVYETWSKLGFGKSLSLMSSIETPGVLKLPYEWSNSDKRTASYGYGPMNANLAQLARAYLVFGNDGSMPRLKLFQNFNKFDEENVKVFKKETVSNIASHLQDVVEDGSGYRAEMIGHKIAGKTGTVDVRLASGGYSKKGNVNTYFSGFSPVVKPKYFMSINLNKPKKCFRGYTNEPSKCEGSNTAAIAFNEAMDKILNNDILDYNLAQK